MTPQEALSKAKDMGLDLVEIAPNADPPVCRICDYGKWKYEQSKQKKHSKSKTTRQKEVKFRVGIEQHDYEIKMARGERFLGDGHKLRVQVMFRGRQMAHPEIGMELIHKVIEDYKTMAHADSPPRHAGRFISTTLSPLPEQQRVPKFHHVKGGDHDEEEDDDHDDDDHFDEDDSHDEPAGEESQAADEESASHGNRP